MTTRSSIVPYGCLFAALCFAAGMIAQGLFLDSRIDKRLLDYEDYIVSQQRFRDSILEAHDNLIDYNLHELGELHIIADSLGVECAANRACWLRSAGKGK